MFNHCELVQRGRKWLSDVGCGVILCEFRGSYEQPDALGFHGGTRTFLLECKASRGDFLADRNKAHRKEDAPALGNYRYYLCEADLIRADEIPPRWGLLYVYPTVIRVITGYNPRTRNYHKDPHWRHTPDRKAEAELMYIACRRLQDTYGHDAVYDVIHPKTWGQEKVDVGER